jgi:thioredoxin-like negative regulator of GroEL
MVSFEMVGVQRQHAFRLQTIRTVCSALMFVLSTAAIAQAQKAGDFTGAPQPTTPSNVQLLSPSGAQGGLFSIEATKRLISEAEGAVASQNYSLAAAKLQDARQVSNQLSNFYQALASSFLGVDNRASDSLRRKALDSAQLRDQSTYQLALVYRAQSKTEQAIPLLIEIIRSQNPSRELGQKSYQQLFELGFVDVPYPRTPASAPPAPSSATPAPSK